MTAAPLQDDELAALFARQQQAFRAAPARTHAQRIAALDALLNGVLDHEDALVAALHADFGNRPAHETRLLEIFPLVDEIRHIKRALRGWMRPRAAPVNWQFLPGRASVMYQPLGVVGVIGAWNYPILLTLSPLVNALAAGNHAMVKPSELAPATARVLGRMLGALFGPEYVALAEGGAERAAAFCALPFDHILFTGSARVGQLVLRAAAANLTPVTLELGGKSPALVHASYPTDVAADRICSAKFWNAGQTCVAPDYALVPAHQLDEFVRRAEALVARRFPRLVGGPCYTHMINPAAWRRMRDLLDDARDKGARVLQINPAGECCNEDNRAFPPTLVVGADASMRVMQEEIFGPILPVLGYDALEAAIAGVNAGPRPLALYYFDKDPARVARVLEATVSGGVTVNDCVFHLVQHNLPFGGVGPSGMGAYHGFDGFATFSKKKGVLRQNGLVGALMARWLKPPYGRWSGRLLALLIGRRVPAKTPPAS